jgi:guanylate kinase
VIIKHGSIFLTFVGPAGSGKTTLSSMLEKTFSKTIMRAISATSRAARKGEKEGVDYYFVERAEFERKARSGEFFEWEETHGNLYGTPRSELLRAQEARMDLILDIDIRGAISFKREYPKECSVILLLPKSPEVLRDRLNMRKTSEKEMKTRLETAEREYEIILDAVSSLDYVVVNDSLNDTFEQVKSLYIAEQHKLARVGRAALEPLCKI